MSDILSPAINGTSTTPSSTSPLSPLNTPFGILTPSRTARPTARRRTDGLPAVGVDLASLGIYARSSAEKQAKKTLPEGYDPMESRVARFSLQSVSRKLLPDSRTANCLRLRAFGQEIQVIRSIEYKTASYTGLQTCGSVWVCPVCAAKIAERRRVEIQTAMALHKASGGSVYLLTLTFAHKLKELLTDNLDGLSLALRYFKEDFSVRSIFRELGILGQIRALEVTHGRLSPSNNGWHPHPHILLFGTHGGLLKPFEDRLYERWAACCVRAGLGMPSRLHGVKLDDGTKAALYVSKWGLEDEMTKGHTKKSKNGETPFDFLRAVLANAKDKQAGFLFKEYAEAFKGKRQLYWSSRLKKHFKIGEITDEELLAKTEDDAAILGLITYDQWREVLRDDGRAFLLQLAAKFGWSPVAEYLEVMQERHNERKRQESQTVFEEVTSGWSEDLAKEFAKSLNLKGSK